MRLFFAASSMMLLMACGRQKQYTITTYFNEYDSNGNPVAKNQKYSYEEFDADSTLLYKEEYAATFGRPDTSKRISKISYEYSDTLLKRKIIRFKTETNEGKEIVEYRYSGKLLMQESVDGNPAKRYEYDPGGNLVKEIDLGAGIQYYDSFAYNIKGLRVNSYHFRDGVLYEIDTTYYDDHSRMTRFAMKSESWNEAVEETYTWNDQGRMTERKRTRYDLTDNNDRVWQQYVTVEKFFYDDKGVKTKFQQFKNGVLRFELTYKYN